MQAIQVIDSHTAGEPTRVVVAGGPDLGLGTMAQRLAAFRERHDRFRSAIVNEPRGSDALVGAMLCEPVDPSCAAGVIFFNNVGYLGMCGHGTIGVLRTLSWLGRIEKGTHRIETPVGIVEATLDADASVTVANVPSWRKAAGVSVDVPGAGRLNGDVAWGGNWFYLINGMAIDLTLANIDRLLDLAWRARQAINAAGYTEVDHIEFFGPPGSASAHSRNFVLCPGRAYDRSPCGTGTSAKLACLAADGKLAPGEVWVQESIVGTCFGASYRWADRAAGSIVPTIRGTAFITAEARLLLEDADPFRWGIGTEQDQRA